MSILLFWDIVVSFVFITTFTGIFTLVVGVGLLVIQLWFVYSEMEFTRSLSRFRLSIIVPLVVLVGLRLFLISSSVSTFESFFAWGTLLINLASLVFDVIQLYFFWTGRKHYFIEDDEKFIYSGLSGMLSEVSLDLDSDGGI